MYNREPSPAGWYRDPYGPGQRYFNGTDWTDATSDDPAVATPVAVTAPTSPRPAWLRVIIMIAIAVVLLLPTTWLNRATGGGWTSRLELADWARTLWPAFVMAVVGPYISYRRRDWLLMLVPLYGWWLIFVIGWRLAYLPYRDWSPRPEEAASWQQLRHPLHPGALLYRARPTSLTAP